MINTTELDKLIIGRVEPRIYAFSTNTIPNYLKIGDTYRPVTERLNEWRHYFPNLRKEYDASAKVDENVYFRDFSIHDYLENDKHKIRLIPTLFPSLYYSKEFFKDTKIKDVKDAIQDIKDDYKNKTQKYNFYNSENRLPEIITYARVDNYEPRIGTQDLTIKNFKNAVQNGRTNLLMYAVMRFGKSFTAMCCANEMGAKLVVIVSGKADIKNEWKKTVESHIKFEDYIFASSEELIRDEKLITNTLKNGKKIVVFLTLQDLMGSEIKEKHKDLFENKIDLLLVDESHFGARAERYGEVLKKANVEKDVNNKKDTEDVVDLSEVNERVKTLNSKVTIHMSGTPYRILMSDEFEKDDIIAFYQFTDIVDAQDKWNKENLLRDDTKEWDNPYFGFPQMVRFAFNPNKSTIKKLEELKQNGFSYAFSELLKPKCIKKDNGNLYKTFKYEKEVLELLEVIDGSKKEESLLSFLDYDKIKNGKLCSHIVFVLPYCSSCDALEKLIKDNEQKFKNLNKYKIINIAGLDSPRQYDKVVDVKRAISNFEKEGQKTISLTVNRMLTGCTIPEWDTMIYLKDTSSPQEYDQSIFRLQSQFIKTYIDKDKNKIKINMKPQTLLVDFEPSRMFAMQEAKAQIYNVNKDEAGNSKLKNRLEKELKISPIFTLNQNKISQVTPNNILDAISNYKKDKGIKEEALAIPVDLDILNFEEFKKVIELENEIDSKAGLTAPAYGDGNGDDLNTGDNEENADDGTSQDDPSQSTNSTNKDNTTESLSKKIQNYYTRILLFSFLTKDKVISLSDIINIIDKKDNKRIAGNLGLRKQELKLLNDNYNKWALRKLDYSIQDLNSLSTSADINTALKKFGKLGEAIVITPNNICDDMINLIPESLFKKSPKYSKRYLDIAGTSGEFALALYNKMKKMGLKNSYIKDAIYTIPKSSICYELTRKLYDLLGLNIDNISTIYAQDIIKTINDYNKIKLLLTQSKKFSEIKLKGEVLKGGNMKFDAIVGNPPYQEGRKSIFQYFQIMSDKLSPDCSCLIYPGQRWIHQAGKGMNEFGKSLINDKNLAKLIFYPNSKDVFDAVDVSDGISIVLKNFHNLYEKLDYTYINGKDIIPILYERPKDKMLSICPRDFKIINKIEKFVNDKKLSWIHDSVSDQKFFGIESDFVERNRNNVRLFTNNSVLKDNEIKLLTNDKSGPAGRSKWFIVDRTLIEKSIDYIDKWKVVVSSAHPGGQDNRDNQLEVLGEKTAFGRARVSLKSFITKDEAVNCYNYFKSNFVKYSLLLSDEALSSFAKYVPDLIDYTNGNKMIDFKKPIDKQLYDLIGLKDEEIKYIENTIKPME